MRCTLVAPVMPAAAFLLLLAGEVGAQRALPLEGDGPVLRLEIAKPIFDVGEFHAAHVATTTMDASMVVPLGPSVAAFALVGMSFGQIGGLGWSSTVSNARLGAALGRDRGLGVSVYTDLPLAHEMGNGFATGVGRFTHFEEWPRYMTSTWSVGGSATAERELSPGAFVGARVDGTMYVPLEDGSDSDVLSGLTVYADAPTGPARIWIELSALAALTQPDLNIGQRTTLFGLVSVSLPTHLFAPEAYVRAPVDENLGGIISFVLGARMHIGSTRPSR